MKTYEKNMADTALVVKSLKVLENIDGGGLKEIKNTVESVKRQTAAQAKQQEEYWKSLSDDGVITVIEKQTLYRETQNIARSYAAITQQAAALQITAALLNDFVRTYEALHTYLYTTLKVFDDMSSETVIDSRDVFNAYFSNYYFEENFVLIAITAGILDTLEFRVLESLSESGEEGETAIYRGGLYQYVNGAWKSVTTGAYKGPRTELPGDEEDSFFIVSESFTITEGLIINGEELYVNGEPLGITHTYLKGIIYYQQDGVWCPENDRTNWRYAAAFADVINITGELPQIFQDAIDDLQDQIDTKANAASLAQEIQDRQGQYTIINGDIVQINNNIVGIIARVTSNEGSISSINTDLEDIAADINDITSDIDGPGGITEQITDIANDIDGDDGIKDKLLGIASNITDINSDITGIISDISDINTDINGTNGIKTQIQGINSDILDIDTDINGTEGIKAKLQEQADALIDQANALDDLADEVDNKATKTALNSLATELRNRAEAIEIALGGKISHLPVYFGPSATIPSNPLEGDFFLYTGTNSGKWIKSIIYRWHNNSWYDTPDNSPYGLDPTNTEYRSYYMTALEDVLATNVAGTGYFSTIFTQSFFSNSATLESLATKEIYLRQNGHIMSDRTTYDFQKNGFKLDSNGDIDANGNMHFGASSTNKVAIGVDLYN
jgi:predicted  nucleic acid-binding Zn-ribbon protein